MANGRRYRLYIDESGDHTFNQVSNPHHRYLTLMGVWFERGDAYNRFASLLQRLKDSVFGPRPDEPVCLHRRDIIDRRGPFGVLKEEAACAKFNNGVLWLAEKSDFLMCGVVLDKQTHESKTYRELIHPYHYCLAALLERYAGWLSFTGSIGDVMAEARGRTEDRQLRRAFERLYEDGTRFHAASQFQQVLTSQKLKLKRKEHNIAGLQLSDLLASPVKREIVGRKRYSGFGGRLVDAARSKFNRHVYRGTVQGYGKVLLK